MSSLTRKGNKAPVRVKCEPLSSESEHSSGSENDSQERFRVKEEPQSDMDVETTNNVQPQKKYKRIKLLNEDSGSDSDVEKIPQKRPKKSRIQLHSSSESEEDPKPKVSRRIMRRDSRGSVKVETSESEESSNDSDRSECVIEFESDSDDQESDKSYTSSETDEIDDDGLSKECLLCRNLGKASVAGRQKSPRDISWCKCGHCKVIGYMKDYDRVCCRELKDVVVFMDDEMDDASKYNKCVTTHPRFEIEVLQHRALQRTKYSKTNYYGNEGSYDAAWSFIRWIWNKIGWGTRMAVPACVSARIKEKYGPNFKCFTAITTCEKRKHCANAQK